jgi:serine/threonine protein kinase/Tol biopolymer transport system component
MMALAAGTRLGSYEVASQIGAGGMGEVYQAHDTKLGRDVAIKVLPSNFVNDPERLSRFQREARMLAALNYPNIAAIYGLEQCDGVTCLVMELVSGDTLAERVKAGPLGIEEALKIAVQIAEALEAAHEKSIIHRDLKPANVKVTPEGKVKVLDFGLAKAFASDTTSEDIGNSPTLSMAATMQGVILGTAAYMSPEQARGKACDKRTDIWAFGCVLYELLAGNAAFNGEDITDILAAVVRAEPDWSRLPPSTPTKIRNLLRRCLQKDRRQRFHDAADVRIEIEETLAAPNDSGATQSGPASISRLLLAVGTVAAALAIIAVVASWGWWRATRPVEQSPRPLIRLDVDLGPDVSLGSQYGTDAILSPDGTRVVYVSRGRLFTRRLDQPNATELSGTQGAVAPFFSPDGQWVAFFALGKLNKISVEGGATIALCDTVLGRGGSWGDDGDIIAALSGNAGLSRIPSAGGPPTPVTELQSGETSHRWPQVLPGGKAVLFTASTGGAGAGPGYDGANIEVMSLADHHRKTLQRGGTFGRYLPSGHLIYVSRGTLFAVPFDLNRLEVRGTPSPVLNQVGYSTSNGTAEFDFSQTGTLVYRSGEAGGGLVTVQWLDAAGKTEPLLAKTDAYTRPSLSPDGNRLAIATTADIWVYEWQRDTMTRLTFGGVTFGYPLWSPDGRYIVFQSPGGMFWTRSDGSGKPQPLTQSKNRQLPSSFTPDGKRLAFHELMPLTQNDIWTVPLESDASGLRAGKPEPFLQTPFDERHGAFSPDGRWMAYDSNESGVYQVYVRAFPDKGGKWQISNSGGLNPVFSRNGHDLFFRNDANQIMVVGYTIKGDSYVADKPRVWSENRLADLGVIPNYDLAPDGKRIVALMPAGTPEVQRAQSHVIFLENFFDEVRRRTATQAK